MPTHIYRPAAGLLIAFGLSGAALASEPDKAPPHQAWSFEGPLGQYDQSSLQRGFIVFQHVCSTCHGMRNLTYTDLAGIGLTQQQIAETAKIKPQPGAPDAAGQPTMRPGLPDDHLNSPFPNDAAAAAMIGGIAPPAQSRLAITHPGGPERLYAFLTGYRLPPPADAPAVPGKFYNDKVAGTMFGMSRPLM